MEYILLSADSVPSVYLVPEAVVNDLAKYCNNFWDWMQTNPCADKHRVDFNGYLGFCYDEHDFIEYLNTWIFPDAPSRLVEKLNDFDDIPIKYKNCKSFNF